MFNFLKRKPKSFLGIDIGTSSIKIIQLGRTQEKAKLETYGFLETYGSVELTNAPIQTSSLKILDSQVAEMLKRLIDRAGVTTNVAVMSVPIFSTFSAIMELPDMPKDEISHAVKFEAKKYIPVPLSEVILDWNIVGEKIRKLPGGGVKKLKKIQVLLLAIPKELANNYINISKSVGLEIKALEAESLSLTRSIVLPEKDPVLLIDIGRRTTGINIVDNGFVMMSRGFDTSGNEITKVLSLGLNIDFNQAEIFKKNAGLMKRENQSQIPEIILPVIDIIKNESERLADLHHRRSGRKVKKVILAGGSAELPGLIDYFTEAFALPCVKGNPWNKVSYPEILKPTLEKLGAYFAVAVGLAMRKVSEK